MTIEIPPAGHPRRPLGPRDPGDAWVVADSGERYWGRFGAAGVLAADPDRGILLQYRVGWSHHGDTWGLPGGARHQGESALDGALREAHEEAGVPAAALRVRLESVLDLSIWTYTTIVADVVTPFEPVIGDAESRALEWVPVARVVDRPLHPGFAAAWPRLRSLLAVRPVLVLDAANIVGSVPDGWWKDRAAAAGRLLQKVAGLRRRGVDAAELALPEDRWFPDVTVVLEGRARSAADVPGVDVVRAEAAGDDTIVAEAARLAASDRHVTVVTSDRELGERCRAEGAAVVGTAWLRALL